MLFLRILFHAACAWPVIIALAYATKALPGFQVAFAVLEPGAYVTASLSFAIVLNDVPIFLAPLGVIVVLAILPADIERIITFTGPILLGALLGMLGRALTFASRPPMQMKTPMPFRLPGAQQPQAQQKRPTVQDIKRTK